MNVMNFDAVIYISICTLCTTLAFCRRKHKDYNGHILDILGHLGRKIIVQHVKL